MAHLPTLEARTSSNHETDIVAVYQDSGKKPIPTKGPYSVLIERFRKSDGFLAKQGSVQFVRFGGKKSAENVLFIGLGPVADLTEEKIRQAAGNVWAKLSGESVKTAGVQVDSLFDVKGLRTDTHQRWVRAFAEGLILPAYQFKKYHTGSGGKENNLSKVTFLTKDKNLKTLLDHELASVSAIGESVQVTRDWSNEPSNVGTPEYYAAESKKLAEKHGLKCRILTEADAKREKMGLFLSVGQGSERESRVVVVEYDPKKSAKAGSAKTIALVGKGVTFDSGGISIKPSARMEEMKHDMTGAATMMGAILLAAKWKVPNRIVAILGFTENMPDGIATQPGNVVTSRAGKTVEIINTDAEGRLVLADILDYAHEFKPDVIIDSATLTGAVSIALGKICGGILGNDDSLVEAVCRAGEVNGEKLWQLPLYDEYFDDMKSDYADMRNACNDSNGGTIRGAIFLKQFIKKGMPWAHIDLAATCYNTTHLSYFPKKGANGQFVRTLAQFAADF